MDVYIYIYMYSYQDTGLPPERDTANEDGHTCQGLLCIISDIYIYIYI